MADVSWKVAQHGPLVTVTEGVWVVDATLDLLPIGRRMTILRGATGELVIHSAVACDEPTMQRIEALGPVGSIVVPSASHKIDAPRYAARYPEARVICPRPARHHVEKALRVQGHYDALAPEASLRVETLDGVPGEGVFIHSDAKGQVTLVLNDALMNLPAHLPGFKGWITQMMGSTGGPKVTPTARRFIVKDARAYGAHLRRLADLPGLSRIVVSHGELIQGEAPEILRRVAATLD